MIIKHYIPSPAMPSHLKMVGGTRGERYFNKDYNDLKLSRDGITLVNRIKKNPLLKERSYS